VSGQTTPYIKFRFTAADTSSGSGDILRIYLPSNAAQQAYTPVTSGSNLICQFLPAVSYDRDFSVGVYSQGALSNTGAGGQYYYEIYFRNGGLYAGQDYLLQISEYNTATSSFYMSSSPNRQKIDWSYTHSDNGVY